MVQSIEPHSHFDNAALNNELETDTAVLIAKLVLDDLAYVPSCRKGKARADSLLSDEEIAYELQIEQYNEWLSIAEDAKLAKSIGTDAVHPSALITREGIASGSRITTGHLPRGETLPVPKSCQTRLEHPAPVTNLNPESIKSPDQAGLDALNNDLAVLDDYTLLDNEWMHDEPKEVVSHHLKKNHTARHEQSSTVGKKPIVGRSTDHNIRVDCVICHDSYRHFETLNTPCGHYYCKDCLAALVEAFTRDESLFPLRCCQEPIPIAEVLPALSLELCALFQWKHEEFSIHSRDRLYCANPTCSAFLGSAKGRLSLTKSEQCPRCNANTCPKCKEPAHPGEGCGVSASNEALQALAKSQGWQTCPGCQVIVELNLGCYHLTCRCRTQFCYLCAARWKTCRCAQFCER